MHNLLSISMFYVSLPVFAFFKKIFFIFPFSSSCFFPCSCFVFKGSRKHYNNVWLLKVFGCLSRGNFLLVTHCFSAFPLFFRRNQINLYQGCELDGESLVFSDTIEIVKSFAWWRRLVLSGIVVLWPFRVGFQ